MKLPPVRLFLVRHGEVDANVELRYLGHRDDPLSEHGAWQAVQLGQALAALPVKAIYASPLRRTADTAAQIGRAHQLPVHVDERLREAGFGDWEGLTRAEVLARSPQDGALLAAWEAHPGGAPPGGESLQDVQGRVLALVHEPQTGTWDRRSCLSATSVRSKPSCVPRCMYRSPQRVISSSTPPPSASSTGAPVLWYACLMHMATWVGKRRGGWRPNVAPGQPVASCITSQALPRRGRHPLQLNST